MFEAEPSKGAIGVVINVANKPKSNAPSIQAGYASQSGKAGVQQSANVQAAFNSLVGMFIVSGKPIARPG